MAKEILSNSPVVIRDLAYLIGLLIHAFFAVLEAPMHYRALERDKVRGLAANKDYDGK